MKEKITNLSYLKSICENDSNFIKEMIETFLEMTPGLLNDMKQYAQDEKWHELAKKAHQMKPSLQFIGINDTRKSIIKLEDSCSNKPFYTGIMNMIAAVEAKCEAAYKELNNTLTNELHTINSSQDLPSAS